MSKDLTAILLPTGLRSDDEIRAAAARFGNVWLRIAPLSSVGLTQVEILDGARGLPCESPELLMELSKGGSAGFVHANHSAEQAITQLAVDGDAKQGWVGKPGDEFDGKLVAAHGHALEKIVAADDGTRPGIGVAASSTEALVRGRRLVVPRGTPTGMSTFAFHDRAHEVGEGTRAAPFAYDPDLARAAFGAPARELAARLLQGEKGPLDGARADVSAQLAALGDRAITPDDAVALRALELCATDAAFAYAGGDRQYYWDLRVLPMLQLKDEEPKLDADDLEDIDESESILDAMAEVLPYPTPPGGEGSIIANLGPGELRPLAPWAENADEYTGVIFRLHGDAQARLLSLVRSVDGQKLSERVEQFERVWYRAARGGQPTGDAWDTWRRIKAEEGQRDFERFLVDWTELRIVLELAAANKLAVGVMFYE
jgi:hypothetical protein